STGNAQHFSKGQGNPAQRRAPFPEMFSLLMSATTAAALDRGAVKQHIPASAFLLCPSVPRLAGALHLTAFLHAKRPHCSDRRRCRVLPALPFSTAREMRHTSHRSQTGRDTRRRIPQRE